MRLPWKDALNSFKCDWTVLIAYHGCETYTFTHNPRRNSGWTKEKKNHQHKTERTKHSSMAFEKAKPVACWFYFLASNNNSCFSSHKFISSHWLSLERFVSLLYVCCLCCCYCCCCVNVSNFVLRLYATVHFHWVSVFSVIMAVVLTGTGTIAH